MPKKLWGPLVYKAYLVGGERENSIILILQPTITGTYDSEAEGLYRIELHGSNALSGSSHISVWFGKDQLISHC